MARLKPEEKQKLLADFHTGHFTQRELADKYKVSTATVNKLTKGLDPSMRTKVNATVSILSQVEEESKQNEYKVNSFIDIVNKMTKHLSFTSDMMIKGLESTAKYHDRIIEDNSVDDRDKMSAGHLLNKTAKTTFDSYANMLKDKKEDKKTESSNTIQQINYVQDLDNN